MADNIESELVQCKNRISNQVPDLGFNISNSSIKDSNDIEIMSNDEVKAASKLKEVIEQTKSEDYPSEYCDKTIQDEKCKKANIKWVSFEDNIESSEIDFPILDLETLQNNSTDITDHSESNVIDLKLDIEDSEGGLIEDIDKEHKSDLLISAENEKYLIDEILVSNDFDMLNDDNIISFVDIDNDNVNCSDEVIMIKPNKLNNIDLDDMLTSFALIKEDHSESNDIKADRDDCKHRIIENRDEQENADLIVPAKIRKTISEEISISNQFKTFNDEKINSVVEIDNNTEKCRNGAVTTNDYNELNNSCSFIDLDGLLTTIDINDNYRNGGFTITPSELSNSGSNKELNDVKKEDDSCNNEIDNFENIDNVKNVQKCDLTYIKVDDICDSETDAEHWPTKMSKTSPTLCENEFVNCTIGKSIEPISLITDISDHKTNKLGSLDNLLQKDYYDHSDDFLETKKECKEETLEPTGISASISLGNVQISNEQNWQIPVEGETKVAEEILNLAGINNNNKYQSNECNNSLVMIDREILESPSANRQEEDLLIKEFLEKIIDDCLKTAFGNQGENIEKLQYEDKTEEKMDFEQSSHKILDPSNTVDSLHNTQDPIDPSNTVDNLHNTEEPIDPSNSVDRLFYTEVILDPSNTVDSLHNTEDPIDPSNSVNSLFNTEEIIDPSNSVDSLYNTEETTDPSNNVKSLYNTEKITDPSNTLNSLYNTEEIKDPSNSVDSLYNTEALQEVQIEELFDECRDIKKYIEVRKMSYENILSSLDSDNHDLIQEIHQENCLEKDKILKNLKEASSPEGNIKTPKSKRRTILKSPLMKKKEIKNLIQNQLDCENSEILREIIKPISKMNQNSQSEKDYTENNGKNSNKDETSQNTESTFEKSVEEDILNKEEHFLCEERMVFPWLQISLLLALSTLGLVVSDCLLHGSFAKSSLGTFLEDTGLPLALENIGKAVAGSPLVQHIQSTVGYAVERLVPVLLDGCQELGDQLKVALRCLLETVTTYGEKIQNLLA